MPLEADAGDDPDDTLGVCLPVVWSSGDMPCDAPCSGYWEIFGALENLEMTEGGENSDAVLVPACRTPWTEGTSMVVPSRPQP
jgi:hypothetical protein